MEYIEKRLKKRQNNSSKYPFYLEIDRELLGRYHCQFPALRFLVKEQ
jgi:hypothetical protein